MYGGKLYNISNCPNGLLVKGCDNDDLCNYWRLISSHTLPPLELGYSHILYNHFLGDQNPTSLVYSGTIADKSCWQIGKDVL